MYNPYLTTFILVAESKSFTKAAETLFLSTTAVMKQMNSLEKQLNVSLFIRSRQGIELTEAGKLIYKDAKFIVEYSNNAVNDAISCQNSTTSVIRLGVSRLNFGDKLLCVFEKINKQHPNIKIEIVPFEDNHLKILSIINNLGSEFDLLIGPCDSKMWKEKNLFFEFDKTCFCCAVSLNHSLAKKEEIEITDLFGQQLVMCKEGDSNILDSIRRMITRDYPQIRIGDTEHFYDMDVFNECQKNNNVLLSLGCWNDIHPLLVNIPIKLDYKMTLAILCSKNPPQHILNFIELFISIYKNYDN